MSITDKFPIYPVMNGVKWPVTRVPTMKTIVQTSISGKETRVGLWSYPQWRITFEYEYLRENDYHTIVDFFLSRNGQTEAFWLEDKTDNYLLNKIIGTGNGEQTTFQIIRNHGEMVEPIYACKDDMKVVSPLGLGYTINNQGILKFTTAPSRENIVVSGGFYYRVRFNSDELEFEEFCKKLWSTKTVEFITVK